jgi:hypothetical protein
MQNVSRAREPPEKPLRIVEFDRSRLCRSSVKNRFTLQKCAMPPFIELPRKRRKRLLQRLGTAWGSACHSQKSERGSTCNCCRTTSTLASASIDVLASFCRIRAGRGTNEIHRRAESRTRGGAGVRAWSNISMASSCARNDVADTREAAAAEATATPGLPKSEGRRRLWRVGVARLSLGARDSAGEAPRGGEADGRCRGLTGVARTASDERRVRN